MRVLTRQELTAALAARQGLLEARWKTTPAQAIQRLTPLQGQYAPAPFIALAARLHDFQKQDLEDAIDARTVVKTTINRLTLHLVAAEDFPAYAQLTRQARLRSLAKTHPHVDEEELAAWFETPRTNAEIREKLPEDDLYTPIVVARMLVPLVQLPPAGHYNDSGRNARFVKDPRPLPTPHEAATTVLTKYLAAFGPASRRDIASWSGVAQRDFDFDAIRTVTYEDEHGTTLLDLPDQPLPPADTPLPPRLLAHWDQPLLAYKDRDRIIPPELRPLQLTLSGDPTVTVDGRVAASWKLEHGHITITPHRELSAKQRAQIKQEALRTARICAPEATRHGVSM